MTVISSDKTHNHIHHAKTTYGALVINDDPQLQIKVDAALKPLGFEIDVVSIAKEGLRKTLEKVPDVILLDIATLGLDGWQICQPIREVTNALLIIISDFGNEADRVRGLELGADASLIKPISPAELRARVKALLRRVPHHSNRSDEAILEHRGLIVDCDRHSVTYHGERIPLTKTEYGLLTCLLKYKHRTLTSEFLLVHIWGTDGGNKTKSLQTYVSMLRKKLKASGFPSNMIHNEYGDGYYVD